MCKRRIRLRRLSFLHACSEALKTTRRRKGLRSTVAFDSLIVFLQVTAEHQRMPIDEIGGRVGNEMPGKRNILVTKRWVPL